LISPSAVRGDRTRNRVQPDIFVECLPLARRGRSGRSAERPSGMAASRYAGAICPRPAELLRRSDGL